MAAGRQNLVLCGGDKRVYCCRHVFHASHLRHAGEGEPLLPRDFRDGAPWRHIAVQNLSAHKTRPKITRRTKKKKKLNTGTIFFERTRHTNINIYAMIMQWEAKKTLQKLKSLGGKGVVEKQRGNTRRIRHR